jgi:mRNA-degrading endonuclease YafQ of YafQ-DinJ toxin-antitoxin module
MKNLTLVLLLLSIISCNKQMDKDVALEVKTSPMLDQEAIALAVPILIGVSEFSSEDKVKKIEDFEKSVASLVDLKVERNQVVTTIIKNLADEKYEEDKMKQLVNRYKEIESKISSSKIDYVQRFAKSLHGKITPDSVAKSIDTINEALNQSSK